MDLLSAAPRVRPDLVLRDEQDGCLVYNPLTDQLHLLSLEATGLLRSLDGSRTVGRVLEGDAAHASVREEDRWLWLLLVADLLERKLVDL